MHRNAELILKKHGLPLIADGICVLEVGAGRRYAKSPIRALSPRRGWEYSFCDIGNWGRGKPGFIKMAGPNRIYSCSGVFDAVLSSQVVEHVAQPWLWITELARVARSGGLVALVCPITVKEHRFPGDYFRIMPDGMRVLMETAGLEVLVAILESFDAECDKWITFEGACPVVDCIGVGRKP